MASMDAVVIGAGHNGLVAAAYLAKAGLTVLVPSDARLLVARAVTAGHNGAIAVLEDWPVLRNG